MGGVSSVPSRWGPCSLLRALSGARPGGGAEGAGELSPLSCRQMLRAPHSVEEELSPKEVQVERDGVAPAEHPGPLTWQRTPKGLEPTGCGPLGFPKGRFLWLDTHILGSVHGPAHGH